MFIAQETDLTVGMQTAARAPFVSLFSGISNEGARVLGCEANRDARRRFDQLAGTNIYNKITIIRSYKIGILTSL